MDYWSDSGLCGDHLTWQLLGEVLFIDGEGEMDNYTPGASIWEPLAWLVRSVVIGRGVTSIGDHAFDGFTALTSVSIPETVKKISKTAFSDCANLKEITIPWKNFRFFFQDGMLIDSSTDLPIWPPEKAGKPVCRFAVDEDYYVFRIVTGRYGHKGLTETAYFGDQTTLLELRETEGAVIDIQCIYLTVTLQEPNLFLPDHRQDQDLEQTEEVCCYTYESGVRNPCVTNLANGRLEILLSERLGEISRYHTDGRVEFYCDEANDLLMIRVTDLTEEESAFLLRQGRHE